MELNHKNVRKILLIIVFTVVLFLVLQNIGQVLSYLKIFFSLITPLLVGFCIAFILNLPMRFIERKCFKLGGKHDKFIRKVKRPLSIFMTFIFVALIIFFIMFIIIPEFGNALETLKSSIPLYIEKINTFINGLIIKYPELQNSISTITVDWEKLLDTAFSFFQKGAGNVLNTTVSAATSVISGFVNFLLGIFFAIYILSTKEKLKSQATRLLYAFVPDKKREDNKVIPSEKYVKKILSVFELTNKCFSKFIAGQCTEAVILGAMFFLVLSIFGFKYPLIISVLMTVFSLVPIFGAWVSTAISALLILISTSPISALWFIVIALIIQQIEGNLIYPHVVGGSVGLPSLWVLAAVTLGAGLFGVVGIVICIPIFSVIYALIKEEVTLRLKAKSTKNISEN